MNRDLRRLRWWLVAVFFALVIPTGILIEQAYSQLKWQVFHQSRLLAEDMATRIDKRAVGILDVEAARPFEEFTFFESAANTSASTSANILQLSPLSAYPVKSAIAGLISYFQVDAQGVFTTPLLPDSGAQASAHKAQVKEQAGRLGLQNRVHNILSHSRLLGHAMSKSTVEKPKRGKSIKEKKARVSRAQAPLDSLKDTLQESDVAMPASMPALAPATLPEVRLNEAFQQKQRRLKSLGRVADLKLDMPYSIPLERENVAEQVSKSNALLRKRESRKEVMRSSSLALPSVLKNIFGAGKASRGMVSTQDTLRVTTFANELGPFELNVLDSGYFVLFRNAWKNGRRYIQGALIERQRFINGLIADVFRDSAVSRMSTLGIAYGGDVLSVISARVAESYLGSAAELNGVLLYRTRLSAPLADIELIFSVTQLPTAPGASLIRWLAIILVLVLCGGFYFIYRLGAGQIAQARAQQNFVSAVSHELKTPLTSIRMYGEILREGWASEEKKKTYYDYILTESERLSRLIANVLRLARLRNGDLQVNLASVSVGELMDEALAKVTSQIERAGFELNTELSAELRDARIEIDADAFSQIVINLVDNALKFSAQADQKLIDLSWQRHGDGALQFSVRDYGPGIQRDQVKKIFMLFYRPENELVRETPGTGIGLALVRQLASTMRAKVDVVNQSPGVKFILDFPRS